MLFAFPADGAVPFCHFGVTADPSIENPVARYGVPPFVAKNTTVIESFVSRLLFKVVDPFPRTLSVQLPVALAVEYRIPLVRMSKLTVPDAPVPESDQRSSGPRRIEFTSTAFVSVGAVANTKEPVPVSSVTAEIRFAEDGVARNVATPVPRPEIPVSIGRPVAFVKVPADGFPRSGVVNVGDVKVLFVRVSERSLSKVPFT